MSTQIAKVALITGASSGIGRATALALASAGYVAYATARQPHALAALERAGLHALPLDVTDERSMAAAVQRIEAAHGAIDVLVNNAGASEMGPLEEIELARVRHLFETNVFGMLRLCQLALPGMRRRGGGRIVNVSSMGGEFTTPFSGAYHASKYAVESLSDALRFEVQPFGVGVIVIQPGVVQTPFGARAQASIRTSEDSPYAAQLDAFRRFLAANADGDSAEVLTPDLVAQVIVDAVSAAQPETRYKVGAEAEQLASARRSMSDRKWDALYRQLLG
ncbi:SDR family NAD(P)-dependent oxidoreductase [Chloroflexia bacterium SDU3-3]|nr:SDR family NAD(P)-dependent oxidoreductase [Chloroflexia bacterium SDU3-3]